jgi:hypothetical protein
MLKYKLWFSLLLLFILQSFISIPAKATSVDAITLESISAVSTTVLTGENVVLQLEVAIPTGYEWDPRLDYLGSKIKVLMCKATNYSEPGGLGTCFYDFPASQYALSTVSAVSEIDFGAFKRITFRVSGLIRTGEINNYKLFRVILPGADIPFQEEVHIYDRSKSFALQGALIRTDIPVPTFLNADVGVVASLPIPTPTPTTTVLETPPTSPTPTVTETPTLVPSYPEVVSSGSAGSGIANKTITTIAKLIGIQSSATSIYKSPGKNGDLTWQKANEIITKNINWQTKSNKIASGGSFISTSVNNSKININTQGDAFTFRFMAGKNRGSILIKVDGKQLGLIRTSSLKTKVKARSWIGIGPGKHKVELISILENGQTLGIDAFHVARSG